jgi:hypothetical protein
MYLQAREFKWGLSVNKWSYVKCWDVGWIDVIYVKWFYFKVKWSEMVKFLWINVLCTLGWLYTVGIWIIMRLFHFGLSYTVFVLIYAVVVLYCFVMCLCVGVLVICILYTDWGFSDPHRDFLRAFFSVVRQMPE